tara:strand:+ start:762 stop:1142 length:381 start_codon:yes stop_codon:yes gene_type:complete
MIQLILLVIAIVLIWHSWKQSGEEVTVLGYRTNHFHLSQGMSKKMFEQMRADGLSAESLKLFAQLEDRLLKIEKVSVCSGNPREYEAFTVSNEVKDSFVGYDFSYHTIHLKQIAEPNKFINQSITC